MCDKEGNSNKKLTLAFGIIGFLGYSFGVISTLMIIGVV